MIKFVIILVLNQYGCTCSANSSISVIQATTSNSDNFEDSAVREE